MATVLRHCLATTVCVAFSFRSTYLAPIKDGGMFRHCLATTIQNNVHLPLPFSEWFDPGTVA